MDYFDKSFEQEIQQFIDIYAQCDFDSCIHNKEMCDVLNSNIEIEESPRPSTRSKLENLLVSIKFQLNLLKQQLMQ